MVLATTFCQRLVYVSFHLSPTSLRCSTAWPDHEAKGLLSCRFFCFPDECFSGWLGKVILANVCFQFFSYVSQMIALPDGLARSCCQRFLSSLFIGPPGVCFALDGLARSFCQRFAFVSFHMCPTLLFLRVFFSCVSQMIALLDGLARSFCKRFAFITFHLTS